MPVRSTIQIDIDDKNFQNFVKIYNQYKASLASMPAAWKQVSQLTNATAISFRGIVAEMVAANVKQKLLVEAQTKADQITRTTADRWRDLARSSRAFATSVGDATRSILKWGGITGVFSGLLGLGSLWGLERLAAAAGGQRRSSLGLGLSAGEQQAFGANYGRVVDPQQILGGVSEALGDVTKRFTLYGAGLSEADLAGKNTAQVSALLVQRLKSLADATPETQLGTVLSSRGLNQFVSLEDFRRLRNTSGGELAQYGQDFSRNQERLALTDAQLKAWQDLNVKLDTAGKAIERTFILGLTPLAEPLAKLSDSVTKVVEAFFKAAQDRKWIETLGDKLDQFANYIGDPKFQKNVSDLVTNVGKAAEAFANAAAWVGGLFSGKTVGTAAEGTTPHPRLFHGALLGGVFGQDTVGGDAAFGGPPSFARDVSLLEAVRRLEGSGDSAVSPAGAIGRYQIMPGTARQYGYDPSRLTDPGYNETVAKAVLSDLVRRYNGNVPEVLAGYNAGPGRADRFRAAGDNPGVLPSETQKYLEHARQLGTISININDSTGGNVNVTANQLGIP